MLRGEPASHVRRTSGRQPSDGKEAEDGGPEGAVGLDDTEDRVAVNVLKDRPHLEGNNGTAMSASTSRLHLLGHTFGLTPSALCCMTPGSLTRSWCQMIASIQESTARAYRGDCYQAGQHQVEGPRQVLAAGLSQLALLLAAHPRRQVLARLLLRSLQCGSDVACARLWLAATAVWTDG
jgi:hypothetical protein